MKILSYYQGDPFQSCQVKKTQDDYRYLSDYFRAELRIDHMIRSNNGQLIYNYGYLA